MSWACVPSVRPQAALGDLGAELGDVDVVHRRENGGMLLAADRARLLAGARQQPVDRFRRHQRHGVEQHALAGIAQSLAPREPPALPTVETVLAVLNR